jgi:hypothetical protein
MRQSAIAKRTLLLLAALLGSCSSNDDSQSTGTLVIPYELGNDKSCDALGVKTIRAVLDDMAYVQEAPCDNMQVRFKDIPAGVYKVAMFGVDDKGVDIMDSVVSGDVTVNVLGDDNTVVTKPAVTLTAAPARLFVRWTFGFGTCKGIGIDHFLVKVWRENGDDLLLSANLDCAIEGDGADQYREIMDDNRRVAGDEVGEVTVQPLDQTNTPFGDAVMFNFKAPGPGQSIKLSVKCDEGACNGSGKPD